MGRPQAFDEDLVIEKALKMFWEKGFQGTSTRDLIDATGISNGSFFNSFGDKTKLYLKCLHKYNSIYVSSLESLLISPTPFRQKIRKVLLAATKKSVGKDTYNGCFLYNTILDKKVEDAGITDLSKDIHARMEKAFITAVEMAKRNNELPQDIKSIAFAQYLSNIANGLRVLVLSDPPESTLSNIIQSTLDLLPS